MDQITVGSNYITGTTGGWWVKWFWDDAANYVAMRVSVAEAVREYRARNQDNEFDYE
jgi:hypothetical protein